MRGSRGKSGNSTREKARTSVYWSGSRGSRSKGVFPLFPVMGGFHHPLKHLAVCDRGVSVPNCNTTGQDAFHYTIIKVVSLSGSSGRRGAGESS